MERWCIECNNKFNGRVDKKFCNDQCRSAYNNKIRLESNQVIKSVNQILKSNRNILERLNPDGKAIISRTKLKATGFDLTYHTHLYHTKEDKTYTFCYEYGYLKLADENFLLIKRPLK